MKLTKLKFECSELYIFYIRIIVNRQIKW